MARIGAGHAFGVDNEHAAALSAEGHIARIIAGWNQAADRACRCARHGNHGDAVCACIDGVKCFFIGRKRHSKRACPGLLVAREQGARAAGIDLHGDRVVAGVDHSHLVGVFLGDKKTRLGFVKRHALAVTVQGNALDQFAGGRVADVHHDHFTVAS